MDKLDINPRESDEDLQVNMTPMLDIVFIMLIFFIVTAIFVKQSGVEVLRPDASMSQVMQRVSAIVGVSEDNSIWIDRKIIPLSDLRAVIVKLKQENPKGNVVVKADKNANSGLVVAVVKELNAIGINGVAIATETGG